MSSPRMLKVIFFNFSDILAMGAVANDLTN